MKNICFIQHVKLTNVSRRITYISSEKKQENLYAVYETVPRKYWRELAKENQADFKRSGTKGECIEARELIIAIPEEYTRYDPEKLLQYFVESYRKEYGCECIAALHHNKSKTNYHIHLIYSERELLNEPVIKTASRNMFFDPDGKHVRTKKEATDENGLLPGYSMIPKGEIYERHLFDKKNPIFKQKSFTNDVKWFFSELMNKHLDDKDKLFVFPKDGPFLATKKIGKNNPKAEYIQKTNQLKDKWNLEVKKACNNGAPYERLTVAKKELISKPVAESIKESEGKSNPDRYNLIIARAIAVLLEMCRLLKREERETWKEVWIDKLDRLIEISKENIGDKIWRSDRERRRDDYER